MNKDEIRRQYLQIRKGVINKADKSNVIFQKLKQQTIYRESQIIAVYKSMPFEVSTDELINHSLVLGKTVLLPRVCGNDLKFYRITFDDKVFIKSQLGVEEPPENTDSFVDSADIDLMIVPGVCFDEQKNRLGFGKGFYDRYLSKTKLYKIALAFEDQILKSALVPADENDIKMDCIITEENIY